MVLLQLDINETLDKKLKHYMIDENIDKKSEAIIKLLELSFN